MEKMESETKILFIITILILFITPSCINSNQSEPQKEIKLEDYGISPETRSWLEIEKIKKEKIETEKKLLSKLKVVKEDELDRYCEALGKVSAECKETHVEVLDEAVWVARKLSSNESSLVKECKKKCKIKATKLGATHFVYDDVSDFPDAEAYVDGWAYKCED